MRLFFENKFKKKAEEQQSRFRQGRSTTDNIRCLTQLIYNKREIG
jgi:hypothetical protein